MATLSKLAREGPAQGRYSPTRSGLAWLIKVKGLAHRSDGLVAGLALALEASVAWALSIKVRGCGAGPARALSIKVRVWGTGPARAGLFWATYHLGQIKGRLG